MSPDRNSESENDSHELLVTHLTRHHDQLLAYIYSLVLNWQDAQDVLQKTSLILWRKFDQFDPDTEFMPWATRVAFYEAKNFLRMASRDRHCFSDDLLEKLANERARDMVEVEPRALALRKCLAKLGREERELIDRIYQDRDAVDKVAEERGKATQTIYNRLYKLRRQLLACIERNLNNNSEEEFA